ncbi:MAG: DUF1837 domain-containing protein [Planctomycetes bacterium]|nr:DUF1837 domain-containing protein [Planctomycetota bacterium]
MSNPKPFLTVRIHDTGILPTLCGLCTGYERGEWRDKQLVDHLVEWLPQFSLTASELKTINSGNAVEILRRAAQVVYQSGKFTNRGEFGELLLHAALCQVHNSIPAISKIYYKSAVNETVKGFDAVHVVDSAGELELWLGEAKFYDDIKRAIRDVTKELHTHLETDYLRNEFLLISGKIDDASPHAPTLRKLVEPNTSLDEVFKRACIPVLLTYDSDCIAGHTQCNAAYGAAFEKELRANYQDFVTKLAGKPIPKEVRVHLILVPLKSKTELVEKLDAKLKVWQRI